MFKHKIIFFFSVIILSSCQESPSHTNEEDIQSESNSIGRYKTSDSLFTIDLISINDSIKAKHCFTANEGSKIDCCLDDVSILVKKHKINEYEGVLNSCYDDVSHPISIKLYNDTLTFIIKSDDHVFLLKDNKIVFTKAK